MLKIKKKLYSTLSVPYANSSWIVFPASCVRWICLHPLNAPGVISTFCPSIVTDSSFAHPEKHQCGTFSTGAGKLIPRSSSQFLHICSPIFSVALDC